MFYLKEKEKEILNKAVDTLFRMSVNATDTMTAFRFEKLSNAIEQVIDDCPVDEDELEENAARESLGENWY